MTNIIIHELDESQNPVCGASASLTTEQIQACFFTKPPTPLQSVLCENCADIKIFKILDELAKKEL